jgi:hypothetical protein
MRLDPDKCSPVVFSLAGYTAGQLMRLSYFATTRMPISWKICTMMTRITIVIHMIDGWNL